MAAGATYTPIATTTLGSAVSSYTFSSIPTTYTDLVLQCQSGLSASGNAIYVQLNGANTASYSDTYMLGTGSSATSGRLTTSTTPYGIRIIGRGTGTTTDLNNISIVHLMNYSSTTIYKTLLTRQSIPSLATIATVGLFASTSAITSIAIQGDAGNLLAGSTFTLYGIASA